MLAEKIMARGNVAPCQMCNIIIPSLSEQQAHAAYYAYGLSSHAIMGIPPLVEYIVEFQEESHNVVKPVICTEHKEVDILQVLLEPLSRIAGVYERTP